MNHIFKANAMIVQKALGENAFIVRDLSQLEYKLVNPILNCYKKRQLQWLVLTKVKHQIILNKHMIVRRIYTKAWDDDLYPRLRFPGITILDQTETSTSGSSGLH